MTKERLIIVDDDSDLLSLYTLTLEQAGYSVIATFPCAEQAIDSLSTLQPDLVLVDIVLEGELGGLNAAEIILNEYSIPVILLTGADDEEAFQRAKKLGVYHYLVKPLKPRELEVAVELSLSLHHSDLEVRKLLDDKRLLANNLSREINRMTTFIMAAAKVRELDRLMLDDEFHEWHEIFYLYLRDLQELTNSSHSALGHFDEEGNLLEMVSSDEDPLHELLLTTLFQGIVDIEPTIITDIEALNIEGRWAGDEEPIRGLLCQRIQINGSPPSFLYVANKPIGSEYGDLEMEIASLYANELEKIVSRQRLLNSLMEKNRELEDKEISLINQHSILADLMGSDLESCGDLSLELKSLTRVIGRSLKVDQVLIWMFDSRGLPESYSRYSSLQDENEYKSALTPQDYPKGLHSELFSQVLNIADTEEYQGLEELKVSYYRPQGITSAMYIPIWTEGTTVGVIALEQCNRVREWHVDEHYFVTALSEIISNHMLQCERAKVQYELEQSLAQLQEAQQQLLQSEKMASIGQLAAGVAHEINNPVGYINSNIVSLRGYIGDLFQVIDNYQQKRELLPDEIQQELQTLEKKHDLNFLRDDIQDLLGESLEGISRVKQIVKDLKDFSHVDEAEWQEANLHDGLDSTLNIVWNELKYKAEVKKEYGQLPDIQCIPSQLNQVFMNMLVNAAHAIEERGVITISTGMEGGEWVWVQFSDTGKGISEEHIKRIFDPFFTTKPVGQGTGLGLSLSFSIVEKHNGRIEIDTELGRGTTFTIRLPVKASLDENIAIGG